VEEKVMKSLINQAGVSRRRFLQVSGAGVVTATAIGSGLITPRAAFAEPYSGTFTWISPRGTIEVMDDYAIWVAQEMGYFGDLGVDVELQPGPPGGTAVVQFVSVGQADMGFPAPGILGNSIENEMGLVSIFGTGYLDLFNIAFRKGEGMTDLKGLEGKTVLLGSAAWQSIADPMLRAVGVDVSKVNYVEAGFPNWTAALASGEGDACLGLGRPSRPSGQEWTGLRLLDGYARLAASFELAGCAPRRCRGPGPQALPAGICQRDGYGARVCGAKPTCRNGNRV
jgi:NitT/TauT family transport system substrate-binding protein